MTATDPFEPFDRIRDAIKRVIEPLGVDFLTWNINTGDDEDEERTCSFLFIITPEAFLSTDEKIIKAMEEAIINEEKEARHDQKLKADAEAAREGLMKIQQRGKGIFNEGDD